MLLIFIHFSELSVLYYGAKNGCNHNTYEIHVETPWLGWDDTCLDFFHIKELVGEASGVKRNASDKEV